MKKIEEIKEKIVERFGSVRAFAFHEGQKLPSWTVIRTLRNEKKRDSDRTLDQIEVQIEKLKPLKKTISPGQRELIRRTILIHFRTSTDFCSIYPEFSKAFISDIIRGKKTLYDERTKRLFTIILKLHSNTGEK